VQLQEQEQAQEQEQRLLYKAQYHVYLAAQEMDKVRGNRGPEWDHMFPESAAATALVSACRRLTGADCPTAAAAVRSQTMSGSAAPVVQTNQPGGGQPDRLAPH
jgi:hypothetical protein